MSIGDISGNTFDSLQLYSIATDDGADNKALDELNQLILEAVPGSDPDTVGQKIDELRQANPSWTMDQIFEKAVKDLNPGCNEATLSEIRSAWQDFTGVSNLSSDDVASLLESPATFAINGKDTSMVSLKNVLRLVMLMMIEVAGEESAMQMASGVAERNLIKSLADEKAAKITQKAWISGASQIVAGACQIAGGLIGGAQAGKGLTAVSQATTTTFQGLGSVITGAAGIWSGYKDAEIAGIEGESQEASMRKDTTDKLKQKANEVIQACLQMLKSISQGDYQTMTAIGRA